MVADVQHLQILRPIVELVAIDVMDVLTGLQFTTENRFHDRAMFSNATNYSITIFPDEPACELRMLLPNLVLISAWFPTAYMASVIDAGGGQAFV